MDKTLQCITNLFGFSGNQSDSVLSFYRNSIVPSIRNNNNNSTGTDSRWPTFLVSTNGGSPVELSYVFSKDEEEQEVRVLWESQEDGDNPTVESQEKCGLQVCSTILQNT